MCFFFCIDIFDHEYSKEKKCSTNKKMYVLLAKLKEDCQGNFNGELAPKSENHTLPCSPSASIRTACPFALKFCTQF